MTLVIDASVALKWLVEEHGSDQAEQLVERQEPLIAPDLVITEVCNALCTKLRRWQITESQAQRCARLLPDYFAEIVPCAGIASRAVAIATSLAHPAYDCFYLALAEARQARMVTADARLPARIAGTGWESRAVPLVGAGPP